MKRRDFLRIGAVGSVAAALDGCGKAGTQLIRFVPEETLVPGVAVWKPGVCTQCAAGCGLQVRVMEGDAEVVRNGQLGVIKMGLAKKLEGNRSHPVNHGKLCAWGQAGLQVTYNPDRIKHPLKRIGQRGSGQFAPLSWNEAMQELATHLGPLAAAQNSASVSFLTKPMRGQKRELISRFLSGFSNAQLSEFELFDDSVVRQANYLSFGYHQLPTIDLAHCNYLVSFGADLLGTWNSPVAQGFAYGEMRQGRPGNRGKFVQIEARVSQTGGNADEWVPCRPGTEGDLALGFAHVILKEHLGSAEAGGAAGARIEGWHEGLPNHTPEAVAYKTGVAAEVITRLAREMAAHPPAVAVAGGAALAQTNGISTALEVNALNALLGSVMKPGGLQFTPELPVPSGKKATSESSPQAVSVRSLAQQILTHQQHSPAAILVYETNPVFAAPPEWRVKEALGEVPFIASFGAFLDETSSLADLILPDHGPLETWVEHVPESGTEMATVSVAPPSVLPLYDTRPMPDVLLDLAHRLGGRTDQALPWKKYEEMLEAAIVPLRHFPGSVSADNDSDFWGKVKEQGGWWSTENSLSRTAKIHAASSAPAKHEEAQFDGSEKDFPLYFLPYASQQFFDGTHANLPWMQEMPDVLTTGMWGSWVEIHPSTAARLGIEQGDLVEVSSQHGKIRAAALLSPGISPEAVAMPVGQGHEQYGRYASGRGANPMKIAGAQVEPNTSSWAWASTRVSVAKAGAGTLILFSGGPTEWVENPGR
ncbi:MAG TPA: molybdopterin-dependent oxidoreductase [Candidatus Acidoferrales bacterium]|nr:molybdopterin-dependent oxidoreductase [Candidatus Acidoferrales bacterium]